MVWSIGTNDVLVRSQDGRWKTIRPRSELQALGGGPLSDQRVAFVEGISEADGPPGEAFQITAVHTSRLLKYLTSP